MSSFSAFAFGEFDSRQAYAIKIIPMTVATIKTMAILTAIKTQCHKRRTGSSSWGGNDGVGTEATACSD